MPTRLLVVDDDLALLAALSETIRLRLDDVQVDRASSGDEALARLTEVDYDAVLCDIKMPGLDGLALLEHLRAQFPDIPVLLMTGHGEHALAVQALRAGAYDYLQKPLDREDLVAALQRAFQTRQLRRQVAAQQYVLEQTVQERTQALLEANQANIALLGERDRALDAAQRHVQYLEAILAATPDRLVLFDAQGTLVRMNPAAQQEAGPGRGGEPLEALPETFALRALDGTPLPVEQIPLTRALRGETLVSEELRLRHTGRAEQWIQISAAPFYDASGQVEGVVVITRDVTEQQRLQRRMQEALQALLTMAGALVAVGETAAAQTETVAQRLAELTCQVLGCQRVGLSRRDVATDVLSPLAVAGLTPEQEVQWWAEQRQLVIHLHDTQESELVARLEAGESLVLNLTRPPYNKQPNPYGVQTMLVVPLRLEEEVVGLLTLDHGGVAHDYTPEELSLAEAVAKLLALVLERDRLLTERAEQQAQLLALQETTRRMDEFLSVASHEMRTPVTSIKSAIQLLLRQVERAVNSPTPKQAASLEPVLNLVRRTERQLQRLTRLLDEVTDLARIRAGRLSFTMGICDLGEVVGEVVEGERLAHPDRLITLDIPTQTPVHVLADPDRIGQVIFNFLSNALKYAPHDSPIAVHLQVEGPTARVSIQDAGPGIPPTEQEHIWEIFYRVPGIEVQGGSEVGLGLGLHLSQTMIEAQQGQVGVQSSQGEGSVFWFTLPLAD